MCASNASRRFRRVAISVSLIGLGIGACDNPQPPAACGTIPQVTVNVGETTTVSACFNDPNGDVLTYSATSSNPGVAAASISGASITVRAVAPGNASVTITAIDPGGLQGQSSFQVMVPNRPPIAVGSIPSVEVAVGETQSVSVSQHFSEPDGQALTYSATSSNPAVATVLVVGSTVTVTAVAKGATNVTVTATDPGGLAAAQTFQTTVPNRAPERVGTIPDQTVKVGETGTVDLSPYFEDPDRDPLSYTVASSNPGVARGLVSGSALTITAVGPGMATLTVTARDEDRATATQRFGVTVPQPNRAPRRVGTIPAQTLAPGGTATIDASRYFSDPDGDALRYTVRSSNSGVARASVSGSTVTITAASTGSTTITVTARDPGGLSAMQQISVRVGSAGAPDLEVPTVTPTSVTGSPGGSVRATFIVRNSGNAAAAATTARIYASTNSTISTSDREIGDGPFASLAAGRSRSLEVSVDLSSQASGSFYFGICIDAVSGESDTTNNCSRGVRVTVGGSGGADLEFGPLTPKTVVATSGTAFQVKTTLRNAGSARAAATKIRTFLSDNSTISTNDREIGTADDIRSLAASEALDITYTITLTGSGSAYLGFCVDAVAGESDTTNNCSGSARVTVTASSNQTAGDSVGGISLLVQDAVLRIEPVRVPEGDRSGLAGNAVIGATISASGGNR